ncbi:MAG: hypothetical protein ABIN48_06095 [Ginsengibacter sp.]
MNQKPISQQRVNLRKYIIEWNSKYPIDFIWRKKYGVAFGSPEHRHMSFLDMLFDIEEEIFMRNMDSKRIMENLQNNPEYEDDSISDKFFDDIDINDLDKYKIKNHE